MKILTTSIFLILLTQTAFTQENRNESITDDAKEISGMSILGNDEAPKSLFIVPWKSSEIGFESELLRQNLDDSLRPLDKEVFSRELDYFDIRSEDF